MKFEEQTKKILKKYGIKADKKLGQNFLINDYVIESIIEKSNLTSEDLVIEIGPGLGILTQNFIDVANKTIAIELDIKMVNILNDRFKDSIENNRLEIINQDILKVDIDKLIEQNLNSSIKNVKVIANLPYYITTPIITNLLEKTTKIDDIIVMVQKEVADRLIQKPGGKSTGTITYLIDYLTIPSKVIDVPKESFIPMPSVESQVIELKLKDDKNKNVIDEKELFKLIKVSFLQRRKTLINNLLASNIVKAKEDATKILSDVGLDLKIRPQELTLDNYIDLSNHIINDK